MTILSLPQTTRSAVPFAASLAAYGDRTALLVGADQVTYADLASRVESRSAELGTTRRLVLLVGANDVDPLVTYLAALASGHPILLAPGDHPEALAALVEAYDPDVVAGATTDGPHLLERRSGSRHELHPELALLLTTSGSTGSPKLVRLSHDNLQSNAEAIAEYLGLTHTDRALTTLPLHYCYGLSVVNSHLLSGASLVLTDLSVVDPCFWELLGRAEPTSLAGVPYTFELLERVGFDAMELPSLRRVTQAGGRLPPERVRHYSQLGRSRGWDFYVMYGQTEATARMAYLPPDLAAEYPHAVGRAIPGGSLALEPVPGHPDPEVGELVYSGPNVMLGYAEGPADLAAGRMVEWLRTGDLGRHTGAGLFEVVGRRTRFLKVFGRRIDLHDIEASLLAAGHPVACTGTDERLVVAMERRLADATTERDIRQVVRELRVLPDSRVQVQLLDTLPRMTSGKPDYVAILAAAAEAPSSQVATAPEATGADPGTVQALYAQLLACEAVTDEATFVSLGGDSLSYVEVSIRLEQLIGRLPAGWHTMSVGALEQLRAPVVETAGRRRWLRGIRWQRIEMTVVLRAVAIVLIVGSHSNLFMVLGGAHVLLGVAGFNFARFSLAHHDRVDRLRHLARSVARIAVPSMVWIGLVVLLTDDYGPLSVVLLHTVLGPDGWSDGWHYWYVEALVITLVGLAALLAIPRIHRLERAAPFWFATSLVAFALVLRFEVVSVGSGPDRIHSVAYVFWAFALGWAAAKAATAGQRLLVAALVLVTVPGFFGDVARDGAVIGGLLLLVWCGNVLVPAVLVGPLGVLASASLFIYLTHWQVYPHLEFVWPLGALLSSLAVGIGVWWVAGRHYNGWTVRRGRSRRRTATAPALA